MVKPGKSLLLILWLVGLVFLTGCLGVTSSPGSGCEDQATLVCDDFESGISTSPGSQHLRSSAFDQWWISRNDEQQFLYPEFPQLGDPENHIMLLSDAGYKAETATYLHTAELDLEQVESASLEFNLIYQTEKGWDGLVLFGIRGGLSGASRPENWVALTPGGGYPDTVYFQGVLIPGFSGRSPGWIRVSVDLAPLLGSRAVVGFYFVSDSFLEDWGVGLDNLLLTAPGGQAFPLESGTMDLASLQLPFPVDPLLSAGFARANTLEEALCQGDPGGLLGPGQRVVIKGISEAGGSLLVLHPELRNLCWVSQDLVWVDGDQEGLPRIPNQFYQALYLPVCGYRATPFLLDDGCSDLPLPEKGLPLDLTSVLVESGRITAVALDYPGEGGGAVLDPRTSEKELIPEFLAGSAGGRYFLDYQGRLSPCWPAADGGPGVVCPELDFSPSGNLEFEICWQGWGESTSCPPGYLRNPLSPGCLPPQGNRGCEPACPDGFSYLPQEGTCALEDPGDAAASTELCPPEFRLNEAAGCCAALEYLRDTNCPPGFYFEGELGWCRNNPPLDDCPDGYGPRPGEEAACEPEQFSLDPVCAVINLELPGMQVTVRESTRCTRQADPDSELISSLQPFNEVELLGLGEDGETLVINNPVYEIPCWASVDDFYLENLNLDLLPVISSGDEN